MDLNILHLSDLHISEQIDTLQNLLDDIREQVENIHDIAIVVTGDMVNTGTYTTQVKENVLHFFKELREILGNKFKACFIVPGNHDKIQSKSSNTLTENFSKENNTLELTDDDWHYQLLSYNEFLNLVADIYKQLFSKESFPLPCEYKNTYGIEVYQNYESAIIIIKLDTSWCSLGGVRDKRNLRIDKYQLDSLTNEYKKKCKENANKKIFTIALCHHPLNWLTEKDENMLYSYLTNRNYLNADVLLCGHTHDVDVQNLFSNTHQITTFVTGIGWGEKTAFDKKNGHRYSIYIFNLRRNSCEVIVRKTDSNGNYDIDRDFFPDIESKNKGRLLLPILPRNSHPFIKIPTSSKRKLLYTPLFIDNQILNSIKDYNKKLNKISVHITEFASQIARNAIWDFNAPPQIKELSKQDYLRDYFYNSNNNENIAKIIGCNKTYVYDYFTSLLYEFCNKFVQLFKDYFEKENFRILFRIFNNDEYKQICYQSKNNIENEPNNMYDNKDELARNLKFDGLIEKSYEYNTPLVYSSNSWYNSFEPERWGNYMCIIPSYTNMETYKCKDNKKIPYLLCTISIESKKDTPFLDILNYIGIKDIISDIISAFIDLYKMSFYEYVNYLMGKKII